MSIHVQVVSKLVTVKCSSRFFYRVIVSESGNDVAETGNTFTRALHPKKRSCIKRKRRKRYDLQCIQHGALCTLGTYAFNLLENNAAAFFFL